MHHNFLFDLDQTLLDFHASERKALGMVLRGNGLSFSEEIYQAFKACNKSLWLELEKGALTRTELFTKRFLYVFSLCGEDTGGLDPLQVNDEFIRTMSVNGVEIPGAAAFLEKLKAGIPDGRIYIASNGATINAKGPLSAFDSSLIRDAAFAQGEGDCQSGDAAADMPLPADACAEAVNQVDDDAPQGVGGIQIVPQVVDQRCGHQSPDRSAGARVNASAAGEIDEQRGAEGGDGINEGIFSGANLIFKTEPVNDKADHITGKVIDAEVQEGADDQAQVFSVLQGAFIHAVGIDGPVFPNAEFIDETDEIQAENDKGDNGHFSAQGLVPPDFRMDVVFRLL